MQLLQNLLDIKFGRKIMYLFFSFYVHVFNTASWNEKILGG